MMINHRPCARDNNTECLTAFPTIVWQSVCLIIVGIPQASQLLESNVSVGVVFPILFYLAHAVLLD